MRSPSPLLSGILIGAFSMSTRVNPPPMHRIDTSALDSAMPVPPDPRILFAAVRTRLAWQRSSVALMSFGFVIECFNLFLSALRHESEIPAPAQ
jgi:uncharacterized membrane protein YidH (DUF202 family)